MVMQNVNFFSFLSLACFVSFVLCWKRLELIFRLKEGIRKRGRVETWREK